MVDCRFGTGCTNPKCTFTHPPKPSTPPPGHSPQKDCKFGDKCTSVKCTYKHPPKSPPPSPPSSVLSPQKDCKFGDKCTNAKCTYKHPPKTATPIREASPPPKLSPQKDCYFGVNCINDKCTFKHPEAPSSQATANEGANPSAIEAMNSITPKHFPSQFMKYIQGRGKHGLDKFKAKTGLIVNVWITVITSY